MGSERVLGSKARLNRILIHGLSGPVDGKRYVADVMVPMGGQTDDWIANVLSYVRLNWGNSADRVYPREVAWVRAEEAERTTAWTQAELVKFDSVIRDKKPWKASASHQSRKAALVLQLDSPAPDCAVTSVYVPSP